MVPFWVPIIIRHLLFRRSHGTYYSGYPKRDLNFDNYPFRVQASGFGFRSPMVTN